MCFISTVLPYFRKRTDALSPRSSPVALPKSSVHSSFLTSWSNSSPLIVLQIFVMFSLNVESYHYRIRFYFPFLRFLSSSSPVDLWVFTRRLKVASVMFPARTLGAEFGVLLFASGILTVSSCLLFPSWSCGRTAATLLIGWLHP